MRGLENSVAQRLKNSPGALNVKAGVKPREHGSRREHRILREPPGYYFGKRVLLPECSCRWPSLERRVVYFDFSHGAASTGMLDFLSLRRRLCTAARSYYWMERAERDGETIRRAAHRSGLEIERTKCTVPG